MFSYTDVGAFAAKHHQGDRTAAVEAWVRNGPNVKYEPNRTYADAKLIVAWWAAALARRLPSGMAVYAVSPGSAPDTKAVRNLGPVMKRVMIPLVKLICGVSQTPETAARRYLQASEFGTDVSGQFFAFGAEETHHPDRGDASPALSRSRQPGSRLAGRRQGFWRRFLACPTRVAVGSADNKTASTPSP